jgi:hypothetical protein
MSERRLLIDNDAFVLLAGAGMLREAVERLGFSVSEARRLRSLEFMLRKRATAFQKYPAEVLSRALEECGRVPQLEAVPNPDIQRLFESFVGIDDGEARLYAVTAEHSLYYLASNDKTAMRVVATNDRLKSLREMVAGRVICMEAVTRKLIQTKGPESVAQRFGGIAAADKRLAAILSPATTGRPQDCLAAVESFLNGLRNELGADFLFEP